MNRQETLQHYKENPEVSVLIVGAGVNGVGTFRDLALQGVDVLLVDRGDFCSGASAASSHMVHGGIRYLENGEFRLVREAVQERNHLIQNAPHYVKPLLTVIPVFKWFSGIFNAPLKFIGMLTKPSERGAIIIKIGLIMYDAFTRKQGTVPKHQFKPRGVTLGEFPKINPKIRFTARYYDGAMHTPERICAEMLLDGEAAYKNANALNYVSLERASGNTVTLKEEITGESFVVRPQVLINAAGPWIDFANEKIGFQTQFIGGTKGSHLILNNPELRAAIGENEFFFENKDGRIVLIYPMKDKVMVGTSDLPIENPDDVHCTDAEIDYFFEMVPLVFPNIHLSREQIVFQFSGVRPLPKADVNNPGQISRDHSIRVTEPDDGLDFPIYSLVGGKWTSFRAFSEEVADKSLELLNLSRKVSTRDLAIGGGRDYPKTVVAQEKWRGTLANKTKIPAERIYELFERYGTRSQPIAEYISQGIDTLIKSLPGYSQREIEFIVQKEKVIHLDDFFIRRSMVAKLGQLSSSNLDEIANIIGNYLKWSDIQRNQEIQRTHQVLVEMHGIVLERE
ncbi:MAG: glycerol-3-phosphate dehydrogenase/oxidase [Anaerolineae bacterium]|jgi:glycerol-3-phosphate dehydrogenase|nr:glycerol-3-phosphate dehydrogenase/oxidase [Anaerolineae bacterium]MBT5466683.1 glycerol-3-phosphate dehydrogenase/oxidase [Candidatus Neomarinimicrobiota bacterium]MBT3712701.1 glycerol-3-phosphate dehydrogenase/oxidase [Anaerolineae bacterium]MBT4311600.1 glycerol-3-phosphate dehydrogenase/oxidase [Anaerolineae bacterium]MBT4457810.1 glycerol-3-phosphate dehydrogenase/oxidase [Anaerolineae bacterium]